MGSLVHAVRWFMVREFHLPPGKRNINVRADLILSAANAAVVLQLQLTLSNCADVASKVIK